MTFSAVVSNFNGARFLAAALESVLAQVPAPAQVLVADDGSIDGSRAAFAPFADRAEWLGLPHGGQGAALEAALARCSGEWIAFLESDDLWDPGKLTAVAVAAAADPQAVAVQHGMAQVDAALRPLPTWLADADARWTLPDFLEGRALLGGLSALCVRRDALERLRPLPRDLNSCVDEWLQPRLLAAGPVAHLARPLGRRRVHGGNFFAGAATDPARLAAYLDLRQALDRHLAAFLAAGKLRLAPAHERARRLERARWDLRLHRGRGEWGAALGAWGRALAACGPRPYALFQGAALTVALAVPGLYDALHGVYARWSSLARWRTRLLP